MTWGNPSAFLLLWLLPIVAWLLVRDHRKRRATAERFADRAMTARLMPALTVGRPLAKGTLVVLGLACLIVALARPRWGTYQEMVSRKGVDLFVLLDVSKSMLASDVSPNRLERAKSDIKDLLPKLEGDRVGLIAFAGQPVLQVPLTTDQAFFKGELDEIGTDSAPLGGSLIGDAIRRGIAAMEKRGDRDQVMVLITDGEDQDSFPEEAAKQAAERAIKIFTVGLGDPAEGARIPATGKSAGGFVKHEGQEVWSKMDEKLLESIALATRGAYIPARTRAYDLGKVYEDHLAGLTRGVLGEERKSRQHERFQWFVALGLVALTVEWLVPRYARKTARREEREPAGVEEIEVMRRRPARVRARRLAKVGAGTLVLVALAPAALGALPPEAVLKVREGIEKYRAGDYAAAKEAFGAAAVALPDEPRILFDRGCALAASGEWDEAIPLFEEASAARDPKLGATAQYNLAEVYVKKAKKVLGDNPDEATGDARSEGLEMIGRAADHYRNCLRLDDQHADARHNLEVLRVWSKQIQAVWKERDREKRAREMDLFAFLDMIQKEERQIRVATREKGKQADTPLWRNDLRKLEGGQRELAREIDPLKEKLASTIAEATGAGAGAVGQPHGSGSSPQQGPAISEEEGRQALEALTGLADQATAAMETAASNLSSRKLEPAIAAQTDAIGDLDRIYLAVVPFDRLLRQAIQTEKGLVGKSQERKESPASANEELADDVEDQTRVAHFAQGLGLKASQMQKHFESEVKARPGESATAEDLLGEVEKTEEPAEPKADDGAERAPDPQAAIKDALETAVKLTPQIQSLAREAASHVERSEHAEALPKQEEALRLLEEIARKFPPPPKQQQNEQQQNEQPQNEQQKQDQQQQNQDDKQQKQDQKQDQKQGESGESKDQPKDQNQDQKPQAEQKQEDEPKKEQKDQGEEQKDKEEKEDKAGKKTEEQKREEQVEKEKEAEANREQAAEEKESNEKADPPRDLAKEKAEAMLRRMRQRQLEHRQKVKALERKIAGPMKVEKDW